MSIGNTQNILGGISGVFGSASNLISTADSFELPTINTEVGVEKNTFKMLAFVGAGLISLFFIFKSFKR